MVSDAPLAKARYGRHSRIDDTVVSASVWSRRSTRNGCRPFVPHFLSGSWQPLNHPVHSHDANLVASSRQFHAVGQDGNHARNIISPDQRWMPLTDVIERKRVNS